MIDKNELFNELFNLSGKVALVTGATRGLGKVIAQTLATAGADVALCSRNGDEAWNYAVSLAEKTGRKTLGIAADVSREEEVSRLVQATNEALGKIDILVTSAGINIRKPVEEFSIQEYNQIMDINLKGTFLSVQKVLKDMRERRWGRIVLLGSMLSSIGLESRSVYSASKAAILGLTKTLALETVQDGICVNAICPGPFATEMNVSVMENRETNQFFVDRIPMGRWADPNEIRGIVLYLCSQSCSFMTGSSIMIDGGWTAR